MCTDDFPHSADILLVDDDVCLAEVWAQLLSRHGYHVVLAHDGRAAWRHLKRQQFALVMSDIFMPESDGLDVLNFVRQLTPRPKFLAVSGKDPCSPGSMLHIAHLLGASCTLAKPFAAERLLAAVRALIGPRAPSAANLSGG